MIRFFIWQCRLLPRVSDSANIKIHATKSEAVWRYKKNCAAKTFQCVQKIFTVVLAWRVKEWDKTWHHPWQIPPMNFFVSPFSHVPLHHFIKKTVSTNPMLTLYELRGAFIWEMTYPLESSNSSGVVIFFLQKLKSNAPQGKI